MSLKMYNYPVALKMQLVYCLKVNYYKIIVEAAFVQPFSYFSFIEVGLTGKSNGLRASHG